MWSNYLMTSIILAWYFLQDKCGAAEAPVAGAAGEGPGEGAGGAARAAEPAARPAPEAAVEHCLGPGPALRGSQHQDGDPELGRGSAAALAAQQVVEAPLLNPAVALFLSFRLHHPFTLAFFHTRPKSPSFTD